MAVYVKPYLSLDKLANVAVIVAAATFVFLSARGYYRLGGRAPDGDIASTAGAASPEPVKDLVISTDQATTRTSGKPRVALVEFSDFQCPFCSRYAQGTYQRIQQEFVNTGKVEYVFFNYPLERLHPLALRASEAVECAGEQGKFWEMHDALFQTPSALSEEHFVKQAAVLQLRRPEFQACLGGGSMLSRIRMQGGLADQAGVTSTPTFFIGRLASPGKIQVLFRIRGTTPFATFASALNDALASQPASAPVN
jgi:protein-disulfide isomerase